MKKIFYTMAFIVSLLMVSTAIAGSSDAKTVTIEGRFAGANCMFFNKVCPDNMPDAHIAIEPDFVVVEPGGKYFYILNIDRGVKARYFHQDVQVTGTLKDKTTMKADTLEVKKDGKYVQVWNWEDVVRERLSYINGPGR